MLLVFLWAVVAARERQDKRVIALQVAELARLARVIGQLVVGKNFPWHNIRTHGWTPTRANTRTVRSAFLTVREIGALPDLDDVTVGIADVAAYLAVVGYGLRDEFRSPTFPQLVARLNIRNAVIHAAVDLIVVGYAQ